MVANINEIWNTETQQPKQKQKEKTSCETVIEHFKSCPVCKEKFNNTVVKIKEGFTSTNDNDDLLRYTMIGFLVFLGIKLINKK
jgi:uncharacterized protein (DUF2225 family)